jgi:hypothetical protein
MEMILEIAFAIVFVVRECVGRAILRRELFY